MLVRRTIGGIDAFKVDGKFSQERYEAALRAQGMTPAGFEAQLRQDLTLQQLADRRRSVRRYGPHGQRPRPRRCRPKT
jgi:hypothetical protein